MTNKDNTTPKNFVDRITQFAITQSSRRHFLKRMGEITFGFTAGVGSLVSLTAAALVPPTCPFVTYGGCVCAVPSEIVAYGAICSCPRGNCPKDYFIQARIVWYADCSWACGCYANCI